MILLKRIVWYPLEDRNTSLVLDNVYSAPQDITDDINWNAAKGLDIKNNVLSFTVKNTHSKYVNSYGNIKFSEQDQIKCYIKYADENSDITSAWDENSSTLPDSADLLGVYYVIEYNVAHNSQGAQIKLTCADKTYILFNKVFAKGYTVAGGKNAPEIIQEVIRFCSQSTYGEFTGSGSNPDVRYEVDAKLVSEGGFITSTRVSAPTAFPDKAISKVWKPVYEWIKDLSQTDYTNTDSEISTNTLVYGRPFIFWVDEQNRFHWVYPDNTVDTTLVVGTNNILNINLTKKVFDVVNMVIYNAGTDMYGTGIWNYEVDTSSTVRTLKMRVMPMTYIAEALINKDYTVGFNVASSRDAGAGGMGNGYPIPQFPTSYPLTACAFVPTDSFTVAGDIGSDTNYNNALRESATKQGSGKARSILAQLADARWSGTIELEGTNGYAPGDLIQITDSEIGLTNQKMRVMELRHNVTKSGWFTSLNLEEDAKDLTV